MSIIVENKATSPVTVTVTEKDMLAVGVAESDIHSLESCAAVQEQQRKFCQALDWSSNW